MFWSYSQAMQYSENLHELLIEYTLKYADFYDIKECIDIFGQKRVKEIWLTKMGSDPRFLKTNFMLARIFFDMQVESSFFKGLCNERYKKLELLASQN